MADRASLHLLPGSRLHPSGHGIGKLVLCDWVWLRVPGCLI